MTKLEGIGAFLATIDAGSISEAARQLGVSKSVVSERVADLERAVGTTLLHRTTRRLSVTEDGQAFCAHARVIVQELADATAELSERRGTLAGPLKLSGPVGFGVLHLAPALASFMKANPRIDVTLDLDDRFVDTAADGYDAMIRHGAVRSNRLIVKPLAPSRRFLVASPDYVERFGLPRSIDDLERHKAVLYTSRGHADWRFGSGGRQVSLRVPHSLRVNNGIVMRDAAIAGLGIALLPAFFVHEALSSGALRTIDIGREFEGATIFMAYPKGRQVSAKIVALTAWLRLSFGSPPYWDPDRGRRQIQNKTGPQRRALP
jgi:DNA-binding transcriptional LysR family regulator